MGLKSIAQGLHQKRITEEARAKVTAQVAARKAGETMTDLQRRTIEMLERSLGPTLDRSSRSLWTEYERDCQALIDELRAASAQDSAGTDPRQR